MSGTLQSEQWIQGLGSFLPSSDRPVDSGQVAACVSQLNQLPLQETVCQHAVLDWMATLGADTLSTFWRHHDAMVLPLQQLMSELRPDGLVSDLLQRLRVALKRLKPPKKQRYSFITQVRLLFSMTDDPWQLWLEDHKALRQELNVLLAELKAHGQTLKQNNQVMLSTQQTMEAQQEDIERWVDWLSVLHQTIQSPNETESAINVATNLAWVREQLQPAVQDRLFWFKQQLLLARQACMTLELLVNKNRQLDQQLSTAVEGAQAAMDVAVGIAQADQVVSSNDISRVRDQADQVTQSLSACELTSIQSLAQQVLDAQQENTDDGTSGDTNAAKGA